MKTTRAAWGSLSTALATAGLALLTAMSAPAHAQGMRAEVGKPLQQAGELLRQGKAREALAKAREAEGVAGLTAAERLTVNKMKAAAAQRAGDLPAAIQALEVVAGGVSGAELGQVAEQLASAHAQQRNNPKASEWLAKAVAAGNNSPTVRQLQQYLQSASGDFNAIARDAGAAVAAAEQAGRRPDEGDLLRLADAQQRLGQTSAYVATLEKLLLNYPKKDYWSAYLGRLPRKAGFNPRYELDVLRLRLASGTLSKTEEYMEMAQLSLQAGFPAEARRIVEQGYATKLLGTGPEAGRHQRLRDLAVKQEADSKAGIGKLVTEAEQAKDGDALVKWGYAYVTLGEFDKGIALIQQGLAMPGLKRPDEARLRLGMAQIQSPKTRAAGLQTLRGVRGTDGTADIARLWTAVQP
ncbi:MAG: tetratricopeptide repeat protein [Pseudomonadota bacterium]